MKRKVVALVGSPNVGKSTLFNRLAGKKISIIEDTPGVTRDRIYALASFQNHTFHIIDTGGIDIGEDHFVSEIKMQAEIAIHEADIILFVVDGKEGITANDRAIQNMLLKCGKKVIVVINKVDSKKAVENSYEFYELGFENYISISAEQNIGIYDLQLEITKDLEKEEEKEEENLKFCILGRPNVGKSSLVNAILNEERVIVSDIAGTTRDAIDTNFTYHGREMTVIDTAGLRKKGKIYEKIEKYSLLRTLRAIDRADVCVIVINAEEGIIEQDKHITGYAIEAGKAILFAVNKWDIIEEKDKERKTFIENIKREFPFARYAPIIFLSALTKKKIHTLIPEIEKIYENANQEIKTSLINDVMEEAYALNIPPSYKGKRLKIYFAHQVGTSPPTFHIEVNNKGLVHFSYERYLENKIRESFPFEGTPIVLQFKNKGEEKP